MYKYVLTNPAVWICINAKARHGSLSVKFLRHISSRPQSRLSMRGVAEQKNTLVPTLLAWTEKRERDKERTVGDREKEE
jgi:hypothetical protein